MDGEDDQPSADALTGQSVVNVLLAYVWPDAGPVLQSNIARKLQWLGFDVEQEFGIGQVDGRDSRVNLMAQRHGGRVAIELDRRSPRQRSVAKLTSFDGFRILALRGVQWEQPLPGIDVFVGLRVRAPYANEVEDRHTVNRRYDRFRMRRTRS